jgi:hypothetical protein
MSLLVAIRKSDRIEVMTDAAICLASSGIVDQIAPKQIMSAIPGMVICPITWMPIAARFAKLVGLRCETFDDLAEHADDIYRQAIHDLPDEALLARSGITYYGLTFTGWSSKRQQLEFHAIDNSEYQTATPVDLFIVPPTDEAMEHGQAFAERFIDDHDAFDAMRDGVPFFEEIRRYPRRFGEALHPIVGGFIQHTVITAENVTTDLIHSWPDNPGEPIDLEAAARRAEAIAEMENLSLAELAQRIDASRPQPANMEVQ